jgi:hypothetical protein
MANILEYRPNQKQIPIEYKHLVKIHINSTLNFTSYTYTIKSNGKLDDEIYLANPALINLVPKGYSELYYNDTQIAILQGMNKLASTTPLDNDCYEDIRLMPLDISIVSQWEANECLLVKWLEKANGKFLTFVLFTFNESLYLFGGSKNQHVAVLLIKANGKFILTHGKQIQYVIIDSILKDLSLLSNDEINSLLDKTVIGEYLDGSGLVYNGIPYCIYFTTYNTSLLSVKELLPEQKTIPTIKQLDYIRRLTNIEGCVITYINTQTNEIIRQKHKTILYILRRTCREVICKMSQKTSSDELYKRVARRIEERCSNDFLRLSTVELNNTLLIAKDLCNWLPTSKFLYKDLHCASIIGMAKVLYEFEIRHLPINLQPITVENTVDYILYKTVIALAKYNIPTVVVMSGLPGSGKTTIANMLLKECISYTTIEIFSTDELFMIDGKYQYDSSKIAINHKINYDKYCASTANIKIIDNCNLTPSEYQLYFTHAKSLGSVCILLATKETDINVLSRNIHSVSRSKLKYLHDKRKTPLPPNYYGVFIRSNLLSINHEKKYPLCAITAYVNNSHILYDELPLDIIKFSGVYVNVYMGNTYTCDIGTTMLVDFKAPSNLENYIKHIALNINKKYKVKDLDDHLSLNDIKFISTTVEINGVYAPTW